MQPQSIGQSNFEGAFSTQPVEYAGFAIRAGARIIDTLAYSVVALVVGLTLGIVGAILNMAGLVGDEWLARLEQTGALGYVASFVAAIAYHTVSEWVAGTSLGKLICGLRVAREDLAPCGPGAALVRSIAYFLDGLFFGLVAYSAMSKSVTQQRYGDQWAHTVVVKARTAPQSAKRSALAVFGGIIAAFGTYGCVIFAEGLIKLFLGS